MTRPHELDSRKVLIVEDDAGLRTVMARLLEQDGLNVIACGSAREAMQRGSENGLSVIVTDLRLPDRNGLQLIDDFQRINDSPVIIYTGYATLETAKEAVNAGAFAYVEKNANFDELLRHVHRAINHRLARYTQGLEAEIAEAAATVQDSHERLALALRAGGMGTWSVDLTANSFVGSTELESMLGFAAGELPRNLIELKRYVHPDDFELLWESAQRTFASGGTLVAEFRFRKVASGDWRWLDIRGESGPKARSRVSGVAMDITQRRMAEDSLRKAREEFEAAVLEKTAALNNGLGSDFYDQSQSDRARDFDRQLSELAHVSRVYTMGELASGLAHELNQPLCAITNYVAACSAMIQKGQLDSAPLRTAMEEVGHQAARAGAVIRRMRDFVRWREPRRGSVGIAEIVREALQYVHTEANRCGILISVEISDNLPPVFADTIQIIQVILNLLRNGIEAMSDTAPDRRRLVLCAQPCDASNVQVLITDQGRGLSSEELDHVFEPVFTKGAGHIGLGLAISRAIVEAHEGRLWVSGCAGLGSTFGFTLPIYEGADDGPR